MLIREAEAMGNKPRGKITFLKTGAVAGAERLPANSLVKPSRCRKMRNVVPTIQ